MHFDVKAFLHYSSFASLDAFLIICSHLQVFFFHFFKVIFHFFFRSSILFELFFCLYFIFVCLLFCFLPNHIRMLLLCSWAFQLKWSLFVIFLNAWLSPSLSLLFHSFAFVQCNIQKFQIRIHSVCTVCSQPRQTILLFGTMQSIVLTLLL